MRPILSMVQGPESLKHLTDGQLKALAAEVREVIIEEMASTGGALSSALGAVELAIALHAVFDAPRDKLVLEGGHLTPTHTLLAGRTESVSTLHHEAGRREEGASAAISEAAGFAEARALAGEDYEVVAVVDGDAVSAGVALEGLAQAARLGRRMLIVLNDRAFAPASRGEALSAFLSRMLAGRLYTTVRQDILTLLRTIPGVGARLAGAVGRAEEAARGLLAPGRRFHQLGLDYLGPVKGHTIRRLRQAFETARALGRPVVESHPQYRVSPDRLMARRPDRADDLLACRNQAVAPQTGRDRGGGRAGKDRDEPGHDHQFDERESIGPGPNHATSAVTRCIPHPPTLISPFSQSFAQPCYISSRSNYRSGYGRTG